MNKPELIEQTLHTIYLFASLNQEQLARMIQNMRRIHLTEGQYLFEHGQNAERFYLLKMGHIKLFRLSAEGTEKVFEIITSGETFGEAIMFMPKPVYPLSAQAISDCEILSFDSKVFLAILKDSFDTCMRLMFEMTKRLRMWLNEIDHLTLQNATYRLVSYLLYQLPDNGQNSGDINFSLPKHIIASRLSIKPETLSRILNALSSAGFISVKGKAIHIHDVKALRLYIQSVPSIDRLSI